MHSVSLHYSSEGLQWSFRSALPREYHPDSKGFSELQYSVGPSSFQNLPNTPNPNTQVAVAHSTFLTASALVICLQVAASPGVIRRDVQGLKICHNQSVSQIN